MSESNFQANLEAFYQAQRRGHLLDKLETATNLMRETLLLGAVYEELFDEPLQPDEDTRNRVEALRGHYQSGEFDTIEDDIGEVLTQLEAERDEVRSELQRQLHDIDDRIGGFESLNRRIEKIDSGDIDSLRKKATSLDQVPTTTDEELDDLIEKVRKDAEEFEGELEAVEAALYEDFKGSDIEPIVRSLLRGEQLRIDDWDESVLVSLQQSELGPYVNLSLEGN